MQPGALFRIIGSHLSLIDPDGTPAIRAAAGCGLLRTSPNRSVARDTSSVLGPAEERSPSICFASRSCNPELGCGPVPCQADRKSTRLNSSHLVISYAGFCL